MTNYHVTLGPIVGTGDDAEHTDYGRWEADEAETALRMALQDADPSIGDWEITLLSTSGAYGSGSKGAGTDGAGWGRATGNRLDWFYVYGDNETVAVFTATAIDHPGD